MSIPSSYNAWLNISVPIGWKRPGTQGRERGERGAKPTSSSLDDGSNGTLASLASTGEAWALAFTLSGLNLVLIQYVSVKHRIWSKSCRGIVM